MVIKSNIVQKSHGQTAEHSSNFQLFLFVIDHHSPVDVRLYETACTPVQRLTILGSASALCTNCSPTCPGRPTVRQNFLPTFRRCIQYLSQTLFESMVRPNCCIHHLIPEQRDVNVLSRLRNPSKYPVPFARTERYKKSFLPPLCSTELCCRFKRLRLNSLCIYCFMCFMFYVCLILLYVFISGMLCNAVIRNKRIRHRACDVA